MSVIEAYLQTLPRPAPRSGLNLPPEPDWLAARRRQALARFAEFGFPTRREENWRFTNLRPLESQAYPPASAPELLAPADIAPYLVDAANFPAVLINGYYADSELCSLGQPPQALPGSLFASTGLLGAVPGTSGDLEALLDLGEIASRQPFVALNAALFSDGFRFHVPAATTIERPAELIVWGKAAEPLSNHVRNIITLAAGSSATLVETYAGTGPYWTNAVTKIVLGDGARLCHVKLQDEAREAIHTATVLVELGREARYESFTLVAGARLSRQDMIVTLAGEGASCALDGAYLLRDGQEATIATVVDHRAQRGRTREIFKGVVGDGAHGVFQGKILVRQAAQQTDAHQLNRNLLLGARAVVDAKPELEIYADDVKCSHGATVGDLDEAALFYLRARGIPESEARHILIEAFAGETVDLVEEPQLRDHLRRHLQRWLTEPRD